MAATIEAWEAGSIMLHEGDDSVVITIKLRNQYEYARYPQHVSDTKSRGL